LSRGDSLGLSVLSNASSVSNRIPRFGGGEGGSRPSSSASQRTDSVKSGPADVLSGMTGINSQNGPKPRLGMFSIRSDIRVAVADVYRGSVPDQKFKSLHNFEGRSLANTRVTNPSCPCEFPLIAACLALCARLFTLEYASQDDDCVARIRPHHFKNPPACFRTRRHENGATTGAHTLELRPRRFLN